MVIQLRYGINPHQVPARVAADGTNAATITPHTEAFHAVVWHLIVTHPALKVNEMKWESKR